jgi:hypothetical protein
VFLNAVENANNVLVSMTKSISIITSLFHLPLFVIEFISNNAMLYTQFIVVFFDYFEVALI